MAVSDYYDHTTYPATSSTLSSSAMRSELDAIEAGFAKLPDLVANGGKIVAVNATATALEALVTTGTGNAVRATSPTLTTPNLGTPSALVGTNITGTAASLTAGNATNAVNATTATTATTVTTNANLTGPVTSTGNATAIASQTGTGTTFAMSVSPTFTGTVGGITSTMVGLGNVNNTSDANKPVSTAQATAIALKADPGGIQVQFYTAVTTVGTSTAYVIATLPVQPSLVADQRYRIKLHTPGGANPTLVRDGLAAKNIVVYNAAGAKVAPAAGALPTLFDVEYDGVDYVAFNQLPAVAAVPITPTKRQTVLKGAATRLAIGTGLAVNLLATASEVRIAFAQGIGSNGAVDKVETLSTDAAAFWSGLTASVVNYLFYDRNATTGAVTGFASTLPYIAQDSTAAISVVNGQHTYVYDIGQMYLGNGTTAAAVDRTAEGECLAGAASITTVTSYAKMRNYEQAWVASLPAASTGVSVNHNIGTSHITADFVIENTTVNLGFAVGDQLLNPMQRDANAFNCDSQPQTTRLTAFFGVSNEVQGPFIARPKTGGLGSWLAPASWQRKIIARGNW